MPFAQSGEIMLRSMSYIFWTVFLVKIMHTVPPHTCEIGSVSNDQNQDLVLPDLGQSTLPQPTPVKFGAQMGGHQFLISSSSTPHFQSFNWKQPRLYHVQILFPSFSMAPCTQSHPPLVQAPRRDLNCMLVS